MATQFPRDRFDDVPDDLKRVGAHRAPRKRGRGWIAFLWALLATLVLIGIGVGWLFAVNNSIDFSLPWSGASKSPSATPTPTPTVQPTRDTSLSILVLNGTTTDHLAGDLAQALTTDGWQEVTTANASESTVTETVVYYADDSLKGAALGLSGEVPGSTIRQTQSFVDTGAQLVVVLGSDYAQQAQ